MTMRTRRVPLVAAVAASILCTSTALAKPITLQYWGSWGFISKVEKRVVENFNKLHEGQIVVKATDTTDPETKVLTSIAAGIAPDLFKIDRFKVGSFAAKNVLVELDPYLKRDKVDPSIFFKPTWNETVYGGKCYALPWNTDSRALYYNKTMFAEVGLDPQRPPKTWEDMTYYASKMEQSQGGKLVRAGIIPTDGNWYFMGWLYSAGGNLTDNSGRKVAWNSPFGVKALTFMSDAVAKMGGFAKAGAASSFIGGKCGMQIQVSDQVTQYKPKFELGAAAPPRPAGLEKDPLTWSGGFALAIPRGAKHPKEAWEFIKYYCATLESQLIMGTEGTGQIPVLKAAAYDERNLKASANMKTVVALLEEGRYRPVIPAGEELWKLYQDKVSSELTKGLKSPTDILNQTAVEGQKLLDRAWSRVRK